MTGACARCGSTLLQHVATSPEEFAFEEAMSECLHCGHQGEPREFASTDELAAFRQRRRGPE